MVNARPRAVTASYLTDTLPTALPPIFEQAQHTTANHRKNLVALRKIQETCATITERSPKGTKLVGEKAFNTLFMDMVNRVLVVKKGVSVADRVVKFVAQYVSYVTEIDAEKEGVEDTASTRFIGKLLKHLLSGMEAKDKNVRFRVTLMIVSMINGLGEIDDDMYQVLRRSLLDRARDKETAVRVQAALGLAKLQSGEDEEELEDGEESLGEVLLDMLCHDPAAEVRRAALYNLPRTPETLPYILARTRDNDPILRRTVYHGSLSASALPDARILSIAQREEVVRNGLGDREGSVRKAAAGMLGGWVDQAEGDLLQFLSRFDVMTSEVAEEALLSVFVSRPEVLDLVELDDAYWATLTPEKAFLARVYGEHLRTAKDDTRFEETMPVVTALAFKTQDEYNGLVGAAMEEEAGDVDEKAFVVGELLRLAVHLDYADETGRRKMFQLTREMISQPNLPEALIPRCLDILTKISDGERDLIRVIVDVITELREGEGEEEIMGSQASVMGTPAPRKAMTPRSDVEDPEAKMKAALIDLRCLLICICLLERVNSPLQDNSVFHGLLPDLIIPAVRNKEEPALRDQGLVCLGLCCMIDSKMAASSFGLFIQQLQAADDELKVKVVHIVFDLLMVQDIPELVSKTMPVEKVIELVRHTLSQDDPHVQAAACEGVAKLMLAGMITDESILQSLVLLYFSPESADNQALRQCLTYFLPVYCYSSPENQRHMLNIFIETFEMLAQLADEMGDEHHMLPLTTMGLMMVDWLDPHKVVDRPGVTADMGIQLDLANELLKRILTESARDVRKALVSFLSKLNLPESDETQEWRVRFLALLVLSIKSKCPLADAASKNALNKFYSVLQKKYPGELDGFNEDSWRSEEREEVRELYGFIDDVEERDVDAGSEAGSTRRGKGRRPSEALSDGSDDTMILTGSEDDQEEDEDETPKKLAPSSKGKRMQTLDEEEEEDDDVESILDMDA